MNEPTDKLHCFLQQKPALCNSDCPGNRELFPIGRLGFRNSPSPAFPPPSWAPAHSSAAPANKEVFVMWWLWGLPPSHLPPAAPACEVRGWVTMHHLKFSEFAAPGPWPETICAGPTALLTTTQVRPGQSSPCPCPRAPALPLPASPARCQGSP